MADADLLGLLGQPATIAATTSSGGLHESSDLLGVRGQPTPIAASTSSGGLHELSDVQIRYLYHEPQLSSLCGVHALNNLLQGPYFGAGDLAEVGARIDASEALLLHGAAYADRPLSVRHVDVYTGDFSIEVSAATQCATWN